MRSGRSLLILGVPFIIVVILIVPFDNCLVDLAMMIFPRPRPRFFMNDPSVRAIL
jgi:hypothetical protein